MAASAGRSSLRSTTRWAARWCRSSPRRSRCRACTTSCPRCAAATSTGSTQSTPRSARGTACGAAAGPNGRPWGMAPQPTAQPAKARDPNRLKTDPSGAWPRCALGTKPLSRTGPGVRQRHAHAARPPACPAVRSGQKSPIIAACVHRPTGLSVCLSVSGSTHARTCPPRGARASHASSSSHLPSARRPGRSTSRPPPKEESPRWRSTCPSSSILRRLAWSCWRALRSSSLVYIC